jgi:hypothetical protein
MTTVIDLTEDEIAELREATRQADPAAAVRAAAIEYLRYVRRMRLKELSGKVEMESNWTELERAEAGRGHADSGPGSD